MKRDARATSTFVLIERIARVREAQAQQRLAQAVGQEKSQRECVENTACRLRNADVAVNVLQAGERLDVSRFALYREVASSLDAALTHEQDLLLDRCNARAARSSDLMREAHYRERVSERVVEVTQEVQGAIERQGADERLEYWLVRSVSGNHP